MKLIYKYFEAAEKAKSELEKGNFEKAKYFCWKQIDIYVKPEFKEEMMKEFLGLPRVVEGIETLIRIESKQNNYKKELEIRQKFQQQFPELEIMTY